MVGIANRLRRASVFCAMCDCAVSVMTIPRIGLAAIGEYLRLIY